MVNISTTTTGRRRAAGQGDGVARRLLPEHTRSHNRSLMLRLLYRGEGQSRAELARASGLSQVTVSISSPSSSTRGSWWRRGVARAPAPARPPA